LHRLGARRRGPCTDLGAAAQIGAGGIVSTLAFFARLRYQARMDKENIEQLARRLAESVPEGLRSVRQDLEANFRTVLNSGLSRLDLVTREEFEVQEAVLARTREKLEALEQRLAELEAEPD
jgi:BMFP domain-containing protein YqiC